MTQEAIVSVRFVVFALVASVLASAVGLAGEETPKPNILWLTCEDIGPHLGCYGDAYADTPNLDALASKGTIYSHAWSNAPVCAPARTAIITGVYPPSTGSQHMRSLVPMPEGMKMYPHLLRRAGYYCTNNRKEDYNLEKSDEVWNESSGKAHWNHRREGQPFFAIFNFTVTHESQIRRRPHDFVHDPAKAPVPAYHPDTPEVRKDWAQYYDNIATMDKQAGQRLRELQEAGLAEETIVFFYGDHGSGMPRNKRFPYNSGLQVPLIVYVPEKLQKLAPDDYRPGGKCERLVSFVDLAPTLLSLAGMPSPEWMHGHAFLGRCDAGPQPYIYGFRGRMDERYDKIRSVTDGRYVYLRNYMPHLPYGQHVRYMFVTPTTRVWRELYEEGELTLEQRHFWQPKPAEELYDLKNDPDEVHNLANSPQHKKVLERMRAAHRQHALVIRDLGFLPEPEIHSRSQGTTPYAIGHDDRKYPLRRIMDIAELAASRDAASVPDLKRALSDEDSAVRYWAAMGMLIRGKDAVKSARAELCRTLNDPAPAPRIAAAWALSQHSDQKDLDQALPVLVGLSDYRDHGVYVALMALNAIDYLDEKAAPAIDQLRALPRKVHHDLRRMGYGLAPLMEKILADLEGNEALRVGLARICITPEKPLWLHGYVSKPRFRPFKGKLNDLYAKAMAIEDRHGEQAVLITADLCVLRPAEADAFFGHLVAETGLERRQLLLNLSHTHSGPMIGASDLDRVPMPEEDRQATLAYTARLQQQLAEVAAAALADLRPAKLSWGVGKCGFVRNRRLYHEDGSYRGMGTNPNKHVDDTVPVLRVDTPEGELRALVFGCACHPVTLGPDNLKLSGDYASFAQEAVETQHPGVLAMFVQGCGADANSDPRCGPEQEENVRRQGEALAAEVSRIAEDCLDPVRGPLRVELADVDVPLKPVPPRDELTKMTGAMAHNGRRMLAALDCGAPLPTHHTHPLAVWQFGGDLTLVAISGEVVSAFVPLVQKALDAEDLWIAGYSNQVDGYLPDATIVAEGGYEARGLVADIGFYSAKAQDVVVNAIRELAMKARREEP